MLLQFSVETRRIPIERRAVILKWSRVNAGKHTHRDRYEKALAKLVGRRLISWEGLMLTRPVLTAGRSFQ